MDSFLSRYRNLTVLLLLIAAQLILLGYQVRTNQDVRLVRVWSVSAITPLARLMETTRTHTFGVFEDYFVLLGTREDNRKLREEVGKLKMLNQFLTTQLADADRAKALVAFQAQTPSKTLAARIIANGTGANAATVFVDRGSDSGVESGMAVVTPEGIVGKVIAAYPKASLILLVTDPTFAAGVVSQKNHVGGTLKGQGHSTCIVDYIQNEQKVEVGEWFYTSGYDRVFPRGFPIGQVTVSRNGRNGKEVFVTPAALQGGVEEVLIVLGGVHQVVPDNPPAPATVRMMAPPPENTPTAAQAPAQDFNTQADQIRNAYKKIGQVENHEYGAGNSIPNYNLRLQPPPQAVKPPAPVAQAPAGANQPNSLATTPVRPPATQGNPALNANPQTSVPRQPSAVNPAILNPASVKPPAVNRPAVPPSANAQKKPPVETPVRRSIPLLETDPTDAAPSDTDTRKTPQQKPQ